MLRSIIGMPIGYMNDLRNQLTMRYGIAAEFIWCDLPRLSPMVSKQPLKEALCSSVFTIFLQMHINHLAILVRSAP